MKKTSNLWSVPVAVEDIPDAGLHVAIEAPAASPLLSCKRNRQRSREIFFVAREPAQ